jgi:hypothetical protein
MKYLYNRILNFNFSTHQNLLLDIPNLNCNYQNYEIQNIVEIMS